MNKSFWGSLFKVKVKRKKVIIKKSDRDLARKLVISRLEYFNQFYNLKYSKVFIRNQKTRWGSCSSKGNLNFSYKIIYLAPEAQDYLIVHELCHLQEFNHSKSFWDLVSLQIPRYKEISKKLRYTQIKSVV